MIDELEGIPVSSETLEEAILTTNIYEEIRRRLAARGVPPEAVAFIHDARTPQQRSRLFAAVNDGQIRVLLGSTEKMGTGMNAQERMLAVHQLTPPWRPGDIEQQTGRMLRQGNRYPQVFQFVHITEGSFDAFVWQLLENKASFIDQIARGSLCSREVEDVAESVLSFSQIKALASGNPRILQKVVLDAELARLAAVRSAWRSTLRQSQWALQSLCSRRNALEETAADYRQAINQRDSSGAASQPADLLEKGSRFLIQLRRDFTSDEEEIVTERAQAGKRIRALLAGLGLAAGPHQAMVIGHYRGLPLEASLIPDLAAHTHQPKLVLLAGRGELALTVGESDAGIVQSLEYQVRRLDSELSAVQSQIALTDVKIHSLEVELERPWELESKYLALQAQVAALSLELDTAGSPVLQTALPAQILPAWREQASELQFALDAVRAMHADPSILARFATVIEEPQTQPVQIAPADVQRLALEHEMLAFGQAILQAIPQGENLQLDLFGGYVAANQIPIRKRR
jgi:hypothetical protein